MSYLTYNQIRLSQDTTVDMEHDAARASEEQTIAIRAFARACARRLRDFRQQVSAAFLLGGLGRQG